MGIDGILISKIKGHVVDEASLRLFEACIGYSADMDCEKFGRSLKNYFLSADENVRKGAPELFSYVDEAMKTDFESASVLLSPQAMSFYRGFGCVPKESFTDIYNCYFDSSVFSASADEIFVDGGAQDLFSSFRFSKWTRGKYKAIYAFEPDEKNYFRCMGSKELFDERLHVSAIGLSDRSGLVHFSSDGENSRMDENSETLIPTAAIDDCLAEIDPTYIKLHLEGAEYQALLGAEKTIRRCAPKIAVCVDHNAEDIVRIPEFILNCDSEYKFILRHYSLSITETILYAVK